MTRTELKMLYKAETSFSSECIDCFARVGYHGDVILDQFSLDDAFIKKIKLTQQLYIPDADYIEWLEEKLMELLTKTP